MKTARKNKEAAPFEIDTIQRKVAEEIRKPIRTIEELERFLCGWWCRHYNNPYKCAELKEYTFEELLYEWFDINYRSNPEALEKYLAKDVEEAGDEDEAWLKKKMGENYISRKTQNKALKEVKKELDENEMSVLFDDEEFV